MATALAHLESPDDELHYPCSDGLPMADNTEQAAWIMSIFGNLNASLPDFVAADLLWYPVKGQLTRWAPDVFVAIGRPKGPRSSYKQWEEGGVPPHVAFEILSPSNTPAEMESKLRAYESLGVQEYYVYDPDRPLLRGYVARGAALIPIANMNGWVSPRLGIRFTFRPASGMSLFRPDGSQFLTFEELDAEARLTKAELVFERQRVEVASQRAEAADQRAEEERQRADAATQRAEHLAARLLELGVEP